jgi:hypothetical protein
LTAEVLPGNLLAGTSYLWFQRTKQGWFPCSATISNGWDDLLFVKQKVAA